MPVGVAIAAPPPPVAPQPSVRESTDHAPHHARWCAAVPCSAPRRAASRWSPCCLVRSPVYDLTRERYVCFVVLGFCRTEGRRSPYARWAAEAQAVGCRLFGGRASRFTSAPPPMVHWLTQSHGAVKDTSRRTQGSSLSGSRMRRKCRTVALGHTAQCAVRLSNIELYRTQPQASVECSFMVYSA